MCWVNMAWVSGLNGYFPQEPGSGVSRNLNLMLRRLSTGTFKLEILDSDILKLQMALDKASDTLMIGFVVASLVVGSSLVLHASPATLPQEISWIAILGYTAAVLCGFYAIYHVIFLKFRMER